MIEYDWDFDFKNIGQFYECFVRHESQNAVKQCLDFVDTNAAQLIADENSFTELPSSLITEILPRDTFYAKEVDICKALIRWHRKHVDCNLPSLMKYIRWNLISADDFSSQIRPFGVISDSDYFEYTLKQYPSRIAPRKEVCRLLEDDDDNDVLKDSCSPPQPKKAKLESTDEAVPNKLNANPTWSYDAIRFVYSCDICKAEYGTKGQIARHILFHSDPQFECEKCGVKVHTKDQLKDHERAHNVNFACSKCGKDGFKFFKLIQNHERTCKAKK